MKTFRSVGVIPVHKDGRLLMVCRKDTVGYMEFMRGYYSLDRNSDTHTHVADLFSMMTFEEFSILFNGNYDECYERLYGMKPKKYSYQRELFEKNKCDWMGFLQETYKNAWREPEWGFPKGKKHQNETDLQCALRELYEETGIAKDFIRVDENKRFIETRYEGNKEFVVEYFLAYLTEDFRDDHIRKQNSEISAVSFFTVDDCIKKVRDYLKNRINILLSLKNNFLFIQ